MLREEKNLKDSSGNQRDSTPYMSVSYQAESYNFESYTKTNKLITALYMVTDIMDKEEPLRNKLRVLGVEIVSDMNSFTLDARNKIFEILSFLDIASAIFLISKMNYDILKKEFLKLDQSIKELNGGREAVSRQVNLSEFFLSSSELSLYSPSSLRERRREKQPFSNVGKKNLKGHTNIGVQKGSTLMGALSKIQMSDRNIDFDLLKKQRRNDIINVIKTIGGNVTITDIRNKSYGALVSCGEKTLQRELVSMVRDGVLNKIGEKRWSKYFIK